MQFRLCTMGLQSNLKLTPRFSSQRAMLRRSDFNWSLSSVLISNAKFNIRQLGTRAYYHHGRGPVTVQVHYRVLCSKRLWPGSQMQEEKKEDED